MWFDLHSSDVDGRPTATYRGSQVNYTVPTGYIRRILHGPKTEYIRKENIGLG